MTLKFLPSIFENKTEESPSLNGLRAFSIFFVILHHYWENAHSYLIPNSENLKFFFHNLRSGVDLFFILSGFLIYDGLLREKDRSGTINLKIFYTKRTLRIMPAYYLCLIITFLYSSEILNFLNKQTQLSAVEIAVKTRIAAELSGAWGDFFYISNFFKSRLYLFGWSLSIEEQFYLVIPSLCLFLLFKIGESIRRKLLVVFFLTPLLIRILYTYLGYSGNLIYFHTETRYDSIVAGMLAVEFLRWKPDFIKKRNYKQDVLAGVAAILILTLAFLSPHEGIPAIYLYSLFQIGFCMFLLFSLREGAIWNKFFGFSIFRPFARISYTMYLWHLPCVAIGLKIVFGTTPPKMGLFKFVSTGLFVIVVAFLICIPIFYIPEKPFLILRDFLVRKMKEKKKTIVSVSQESNSSIA